MQTLAQLLLASQQPVISHHLMNHAPIPMMLCRSLSLPIHEVLQRPQQAAYHFYLVYTTSSLHWYIVSPTMQSYLYQSCAHSFLPGHAHSTSQKMRSL